MHDNTPRPTDELLVGEGYAAPDCMKMIAEMLIAAGGDPDGLVQEATEAVWALKEQQAGFRRGRTHDDGRRRLQNPRLKTPLARDVITGLTAKRLQLLETITSELRSCLPKIIELAYVEAELSAATALQAELDAERNHRAQGGIFKETRDFLALLNEQFGITHWHYSVMTTEDLQKIAAILRRNPDVVSRTDREAAGTEKP